MSDPIEAAVRRTIRAFPWDDYGLDNVDPKSQYAEWVPDLTAKITAAVRRAAPPAPPASALETWHLGCMTITAALDGLDNAQAHRVAAEARLVAALATKAAASAGPELLAPTQTRNPSRDVISLVDDLDDHDPTCECPTCDPMCDSEVEP